MSKHILLIVANPSISTTLGGPVGFWASELIHPYDVFINAGCRVTIASPGCYTRYCGFGYERL
jgi:putative intracellular protease/amidase